MVFPQEIRDFSLDWFNTVRPWKDYVGSVGSTNAHVVNAVFREPVHQVLEKIKNEPFFKWLNKMVGNPARRNLSLYCQYYQDQGHTTEECRNLWDHLEQLVQDGKLKELLHHSSGPTKQTDLDPPEGCSFQTSFGDDQCHLYCSRKDWILSVQSNFRGLATCQGLQCGVEKGQDKHPTDLKILG